ncbi:MAG: ribonuclease P protein component [Actinomycetia bacterium]|nr:ribonuclease P protein component [Actinomycetes bacterium]
MALRKVLTIASSEAIGAVFKKGRKQSGDLLSLYYLSRNVAETSTAPEGRVAFIAGKRLGGAVWRNRVKRVLRAALAQAGGPRAGYDLLLVANAHTAASSSYDVAQELAILFRRARI